MARETGAGANTPNPALAIAKGNGLDKAVLAALKDLMQDGTYQSIFQKWGLPSEAMISNPKINGAIG